VGDSIRERKKKRKQKEKNSRFMMDRTRQFCIKLVLRLRNIFSANHCMTPDLLLKGVERRLHGGFKERSM
jgi:hypothetical protein